MSDRSNEGPVSDSEAGLSASGKTPTTAGRRIGFAFVGCIGLIFTVWIVVNAICAAYGLVTGYLWLPPVRNGQSIELYGTWARIVSAGILLVFATAGFLIFRANTRRKRPRILGD